jgi:hypothetical protein
MLSCQFARVVWREIKQYYNFRLEKKKMSPLANGFLPSWNEQMNCMRRCLLSLSGSCGRHVRNEARKNVIKLDPQRTCAKILAYVELIKLHLLKEPSINRRESKAPSMWTPPPPGVFLVNANAEFFEDADKMGAGVVVRDHVGTCVAAFRHHMPGLALPE